MSAGDVSTRLAAFGFTSGVFRISNQKFGSFLESLFSGFFSRLKKSSVSGHDMGISIKK
jgi:hypothetical protein